MVRTIAQLRECSDEELIREHDQKAGNTSVGTAYYVDALNRRENARTILSLSRARAGGRAAGRRGARDRTGQAACPARQGGRGAGFPEDVKKGQVDIGHAGITATIEDTDGTFRITRTGQVIAEVTRTTTEPIARFKARKPEERRQLRSSGVSAPSPPAIKATATR
ncbi:hypothetical protein [Actinomadura luteofluorescens]|uniref:hypothetical protein n=1 Tax=Actinomadura luteofluorescens TaxID=46163 RepID=UPI0030CE9AEF